MKIFFYLLLFTNIIMLAIIALVELNSNKNNIVMELHPEKIVVLPTQVACLEWWNLYGTALQHARTELPKLNLDHSVMEVPMEEVSVYIVHIPVLKTKREMDRQLSQLQKLNIEYQLTQENVDYLQKDSIILGIYQEQSSALRKLEELNGKNVNNVIISERNLEQVKYMFLEPTEEVEAHLQEFVRAFPDSNLKLTQCDRF
ncbi:MAG: hypothetical protein IPI97_10960 [Nitrosomonas sp.]|nr:hypothetical protein [Nitrosomonas sp.]MBK7365478.1 hypothetical protein [Nitrosomonas sp.]